MYCILCIVVGMYVVRGTDLEEPVLSSAYICQFNDLQIRSVLIDDVVRNSETPRKEAILDFETKSLRDTRDILEKVSRPYFRVLEEENLAALFFLFVGNRSFSRFVPRFFESIRFVFILGF